MISRLLFALQKAALYAKDHPQLLFVLILLIIFPLLFLYTGQQFLDVGRANQERLQKDRVGLMHDAFSALLLGTGQNIEVVQQELDRVMLQNPDIIDYKILKAENGEVIPIVAHTPTEVGIAEEETDLYRSASVRLDESIIFETYNADERIWHAYRAVESQNGDIYFIYTAMSLKSIDDLFASRERGAYLSLVLIYFFIVALAFWHIKLTDYRYLYITAKKANETKDLFTNMIAHELRAPLTAIRGYAALIEEKVENKDHKLYAHRVEDSAERLIAIVNDLLDVARIQSGKLSVEAEQTDIGEVAASVVEDLRVSAQEKNITLNYTASGTDLTAMADRKRLYQALTNLVSNAIKYTPKGSISISLEEKAMLVELRVKDTGMGISSEDQKKLFAPFFRVQNTDVSKITGTGLGMWITKELIDLMGGSIGVESIKGVGTHIVVTLPKRYSQ